MSMKENECGSIVRCIYDHAKKIPEKIAVIGTDAAVTYGELWHMITGVAESLAQKGVAAGDRVLIEAANTVEYIVCSYGTHLAGGIAVPVEPGSPAERVAEISAELTPTLTLVGTSLFTTLGTDAESLKNADFDGYTFPRPDMLEEILYTTGTTGKSKGVMITHGAQLFMCRARDAVVNMRDDTVWLVPTPMNHAAGIRKAHWTMMKGSTIVLLDGFMNLKRVFDTIREYGVTAIFLPPAAVHFMLTFASKQLAELDGKLDFIYSGSAAFPASEKQKLNDLMPHVRKYDPYGSSEAGTTCIIEYSAVQKGNGCVGRPLPGYEVFTVDEDYHPFTATKDNLGIVAIRTPALTPGYWNEPELTADAIRNGVIYMTDMGYFDEDGYLYVAGRRDDVINVGGLKIAPAEVEDVALRFEGISECVCIAYEDPRMGRCMKMLITAKDGTEPDQNALMTFLSENLESFKLPRVIVTVPEIPKTYNGKIDRKKIIAAYGG